MTGGPSAPPQILVTTERSNEVSDASDTGFDQTAQTPLGVLTKGRCIAKRFRAVHLNLLWRFARADRGGLVPSEPYRILKSPPRVSRGADTGVENRVSAVPAADAAPSYAGTRSTLAGFVA